MFYFFVAYDDNKGKRGRKAEHKIFHVPHFF